MKRSRPQKNGLTDRPYKRTMNTVSKFTLGYSGNNILYLAKKNPDT